MVNWWRLAGTAATLAACGLLIAHSRLAIRKGEFLSASNHRVWAAEAQRPWPAEVTREQCLEAALEHERRCKRLYAEQASELNRYFIAQSELMLAAWGCLFAAGLTLFAAARRVSPAAARTPNQ